MYPTAKISLIIPLRLTAHIYEGSNRLIRLIQNVPRNLFEIIISDYGTDARYTELFNDLCGQGVRIIHHPAPEKIFSIGKSRDFGVQIAQTPIVMFNDLDFLGTTEMYQRIYAEVQRRNLTANPCDFFCVPVMFLTELGNDSWSNSQHEFIQDFRPQSLTLLQQFIKYPAFGSSAIVINRHHYLSLGGHNSRFSGHGAEDFDLLHRLCALSPRAPRPHDYYTDYRDNWAFHYWGFRSFFAIYGLDLFYRGIYLVHLWHPRRQERGYLRKDTNFRKLKRLMLDFDRRGIQPLPLCDLNARESVLAIVSQMEDILYLRTILAGSLKYEIQFTGKSLKLNNSYSTIILVRHKHDPPVKISALSQARVIYLEINQDHSCIIKDQSENNIKVLQYTVIYSINYQPIFALENNLEITGFPHYSSGTIPPIASGENSIFASFGGAIALNRELHPQPAKQPRPALLFRIWRWLMQWSNSHL